MTDMLILGLIVLLGFIGGELAKKFGLPKVTGFILAGIILNPNLSHVVPVDFTKQTELLINIALAFITFAVGGTLHYSKIKKLGKQISYITFFEAETAFVLTTIGIILISPLFIHLEGLHWSTVFIPIGLLMGALACPTDPSATLAIVHEYKAQGPVTSTIMGIAALDDTFGIINFSIAIAISSILAAHQKLSVYSSVVIPLYQIFGAIGFGIIVGFIFNWLTIKLKRENEGTLIVAILAMLALTFGISSLLSIDELLSIMTVGAIVVNFNQKKEQIFHMLERYTDELIFVFFFTLSGMHLDFSLFLKYLPLALFFVLFRAIGKIGGALIGSVIAKSDDKIKKFAWGGLIPQGGIVIGLALLVKQNPAFTDFSNILISITIGATVIHELAGPLISKRMIQAAGEIKNTNK